MLELFAFILSLDTLNEVKHSILTPFTIKLAAQRGPFHSNKMLDTRLGEYAKKKMFQIVEKVHNFLDPPSP